MQHSTTNRPNPGQALVDLYARMKRQGRLIITAGFVLGLVLAALVPLRREPLPIPQHTNKLGVHMLLDDGRLNWPPALWETHLRYAAQAVGEWGFVTQLVRSDDLDPARWQVFMNLCAELRLIPILRLSTTFDHQNKWWNAPPRDPDRSYRTVANQYAAFAAVLKWPTETHYVTVGNEPNHGDEWGGKPDAEAYARLLIDTAEALHRIDAGVRVMNAGLDPYTPHTGSHPFSDGMYYIDSETFIDDMAAAYPAVFMVIDAWASHAYPAGFTDPPWEQTFQIDRINDAHHPRRAQPPEGVYNRGINGYDWELWKLSTYGAGTLPVFITETGWRHNVSTFANATDADSNYPDEARTALYFDLALRGNRGRFPLLPEEGWTPWLDDPRVAAVTPFALNGRPNEWGHSNWLALDNDGHVKDVYAVFDLFADISGRR